jgi:hypothetical protein
MHVLVLLVLLSGAEVFVPTDSVTCAGNSAGVQALHAVTTVFCTK